MWRHIRNHSNPVSVNRWLKNNPAKFHPDLIWNDGALIFLKTVAPTRRNNNNKMSRWVAIWDQFLLQVFMRSLLFIFYVITFSCCLCVLLRQLKGMNEWMKYAVSRLYSYRHYQQHDTDPACYLFYHLLGLHLSVFLSINATETEELLYVRTFLLIFGTGTVRVLPVFPTKNQCCFQWMLLTVYATFQFLFSFRPTCWDFNHFHSIFVLGNEAFYFTVHLNTF